MRIEATVDDIRALLELANVDRKACRPAPETRGPSRDAAAHRVPQRLLGRYQLLLHAGRTPVVVTLEHGSCSGCHLRLPTMVEGKARRSPAVHTCPHCQRMLYVPDFVREESHVADETSPARTTPVPATRQS